MPDPMQHESGEPPVENLLMQFGQAFLSKARYLIAFEIKFCFDLLAKCFPSIIGIKILL